MIAGSAVVLERQARQPINEQLVSSRRGTDEPFLVGAESQAERIGHGQATRIKGDGIAPCRTVEANAGDSARQHPAELDIAGRDWIVTVYHPGDIGKLAVGGGMHLAEVEAGEFLGV